MGGEGVIVVLGWGIVVSFGVGLVIVKVIFGVVRLGRDCCLVLGVVELSWFVCLF